ncbi:MAG: DUF1152 domain-containing protein [Armatimonadetes bacterium]|nr:DUF1152 domain-containing protein [Armatimonadota bacterium]
MDLSTFPLLDRLRGCSRVLLAGAGGGFDVYAAVPLAVHLHRAGKTVTLGNLSFTDLKSTSAERPFPGLYRVEYGSEGPGLVAPAAPGRAGLGKGLTVEPSNRIRDYFPERALARWLRGRELPFPVWAFERSGVPSLRAAYQHLVGLTEADAVVLVDGGSDSLMRGDEAGLGTPAEDALSLCAACGLEVRERLLACLGFGVDRFHGVCHSQFLEAVADLTRSGAFLGVQALLPAMEEARLYIHAVEHACLEMPTHQSIVNTSVASAVEGRFGDAHRIRRTSGNELYINPLMALYWGFELDAVARRLLYYDELVGTQHYAEVGAVIRQFRSRCQVRGWQDIPL